MPETSRLPMARTINRTDGSYDVYSASYEEALEWRAAAWTRGPQ